MAGHVRKRGEKWYYSFEASSVAGKRKRIERVGGKTKKEAQIALAKAMLEYENAGLHFESSEISVADYMDYWFENYVLVNCKYNTQKAYEVIIKHHIKPSLGFYKIKSLTPAVLQDFINNKYSEGLSKNYLKSIVGLISSSLKYAVHPGGFIKDSPMKYVKQPKASRSKDVIRKIISDIDYKRIIERFPFGSSFYTPLVIGYNTGMRIGEVTALIREDVDLDNKKVNINKILYKREKVWFIGTTKTESSERLISIGQTLLEVFKKHFDWQDKNRKKYGRHYYQQYLVEEDNLIRVYSLPLSVEFSKGTPVNFICTKENGDLITSESFKYVSRVINHQMGIDFNFHALRHTHGTKLIEIGASPKAVQARLGHSKIATTMDTYVHATKKMDEEVVEIFEKAISVLPTTKTNVGNK